MNEVGEEDIESEEENEDPNKDSHYSYIAFVEILTHLTIGCGQLSISHWTATHTFSVQQHKPILTAETQ